MQISNSVAKGHALDPPEDIVRKVLGSQALKLSDLAALAPTSHLFRDVCRERCAAEEHCLEQCAISTFGEQLVALLLIALNPLEDLNLGGFLEVDLMRGDAFPSPEEVQRAGHGGFTMAAWDPLPKSTVWVGWMRCSFGSQVYFSRGEPVGGYIADLNMFVSKEDPETASEMFNGRWEFVLDEACAELALPLLGLLLLVLNKDAARDAARPQSPSHPSPQCVAAPLPRSSSPGASHGASHGAPLPRSSSPGASHGAPDASHPSAPDASHLSAADASHPSAPDASHPSAAGASHPSAPDASHPSAADASHPSAADASGLVPEAESLSVRHDIQKDTAFWRFLFGPSFPWYTETLVDDDLMRAFETLRMATWRYLGDVPTHRFIMVMPHHPPFLS
jgi:hypothetical protein